MGADLETLGVKLIFFCKCLTWLSLIKLASKNIIIIKLPICRFTFAAQ
jgi:hypothetical protein